MYPPVQLLFANKNSVKSSWWSGSSSGVPAWQEWGPEFKTSTAKNQNKKENDGVCVCVCEFNYDKNFLNVTMYPQYNNNMIIKMFKWKKSIKKAYL
jgi:hypothetical protein